MSLFNHIDNIIDSRKDTNLEYELADMMFLTIAAVLSGTTGWKAIKIFGDAQLEWLKQYHM